MRPSLKNQTNKTTQTKPTNKTGGRCQNSSYPGVQSPIKKTNYGKDTAHKAQSMLQKAQDLMEIQSRGGGKQLIETHDWLSSSPITSHHLHQSSSPPITPTTPHHLHYPHHLPSPPPPLIISITLITPHHLPSPLITPHHPRHPHQPRHLPSPPKSLPEDLRARPGFCAVKHFELLGGLMKGQLIK